MSCWDEEYLQDREDLRRETRVLFEEEKNYNYNLRINLARNTKCPVINNWKRRLSYAKENLYWNFHFDINWTWMIQWYFDLFHIFQILFFNSFLNWNEWKRVFCTFSRRSIHTLYVDSSRLLLLTPHVRVSRVPILLVLQLHYTAVDCNWYSAKGSCASFNEAVIRVSTRRTLPKPCYSP